MNKIKINTPIIACIILIIIFVVYLFVFKKEDNSITKSAKFIEKNIKIENEDISYINNILSKKFYDNSAVNDAIPFYLITIGKENMYVNRFTINKTKSGYYTIIDIPYNRNFILSFHRNTTIPYNWKLELPNDKNLIKLKDISMIECPSYEKIKGVISPGVSNDRQNFYFTTHGLGKQDVSVKYEHTQKNNIDNLYKEAIIRINVLSAK